MSVYSFYRDWVDRIMRDSAIRAPAPILLPAVLPILGLGALRVRHPVVWSVILAWAGIVILWGFWRYARVLKEEMASVDAKYEQETRFLLSKEYNSSDDDAGKA